MSNKPDKIKFTFNGKAVDLKKDDWHRVYFGNSCWLYFKKEHEEIGHYMVHTIQFGTGVFGSIGEIAEPFGLEVILKHLENEAGYHYYLRPREHQFTLNNDMYVAGMRPLFTDINHRVFDPPPPPYPNFISRALAFGLMTANNIINWFEENT